MQANHNLQDRVVQKVKQLSIEQIAKVEQFIDSLGEQNPDARLKLVSTKIAESVFNQVWDNPEDADYDNL